MRSQGANRAPSMKEYESVLIVGTKRSVHSLYDLIIRVNTYDDLDRPIDQGKALAYCVRMCVLRQVHMYSICTSMPNSNTHEGTESNMSVNMYAVFLSIKHKCKNGSWDQARERNSGCWRGGVIR